MATKRQRASPTGATPRKDEKRRYLLFQPTDVSWSIREESALIDYVLEKGYTIAWPMTKRAEFWEGAAKYLEERCVGGKRTSKANSWTC